jgi:hypothetical protein
MYIDVQETPSFLIEHQTLLLISSLRDPPFGKEAQHEKPSPNNLL